MTIMNTFIPLLAVLGCAIPGLASEEQLCSGFGVCNAVQDDSTAIMQKKIEVASTASVEGKDAGAASGDSENVAVQSHEAATGVVDAEEEMDNPTNPKEENLEEEDNLAQLTYAIMQKKIEVASTASVEGKDAGTASGDSENVAVQSHEAETGVVDAEEEEDNPTNPKEVNVEEEDNLAQLTYELPSRRQFEGGPGCPPELGVETDRRIPGHKSPDGIPKMACFVQERFKPSREALESTRCSVGEKSPFWYTGSPVTRKYVYYNCPEDNTRPNWPGRFPKNGPKTSHDLAPLGDLFSQKTWEEAITHAFGKDALLKTDNDPHPDIVKNIADWCGNSGVYKNKKRLQAGRLRKVIHAPDLAKDDNIQANDLGYGPITACMPEYGDPVSIYSIKKSPYMRALSLDNLEKIKKFLFKLDDLGGRSGGGQTKGQLYNPSKAFGKACSENLWMPCGSHEDCGPSPANGKCDSYLAMNMMDVNLHVVNEILVKPLTHYSKLSFAEHTGGAGVPDFFVSHNWGGKTVSLIDTIIQHYEQRIKDGWKKDKHNTFYWVCTFSNNQQNIMAEVGNSIFGPFWYGIQLSESVLNVQDDHSAVQTFTGKRAWCVFELAVSYFFKKPYLILCESGAQVDEQGYVVHGRTGIGKCTPSLQKQLLSFSADKSETDNTQRGKDNKADILKFIRKTFCDSALARDPPALEPAERVSAWGLHGIQCMDLLVKEIGVNMNWPRGHNTRVGEIDAYANQDIGRKERQLAQILSDPLIPNSLINSYIN